jgi:hypothetical protein
MSTRALYTFKAEDTHEHNWNVYKHCDSYPKGAAETLAIAQSWFAWKEPRYESKEFACAFIAAGKMHGLNPTGYNPKKLDEHCPPPQGSADNYNRFAGGGVLLMPSGDPLNVAAKYCCDIRYRYEIYQKHPSGLSKRLPVLMVKAYEVNVCETSYEQTLLFECTLKGMRTAAALYEKRQRLPSWPVSVTAHNRPM